MKNERKMVMKSDGMEERAWYEGAASEAGKAKAACSMAAAAA